MCPQPDGSNIFGGLRQISQDFWVPGPNTKDFLLVKTYLFARILAILEPSKRSSDFNNNVTELQENDWKNYFKLVFNI